MNGYRLSRGAERDVIEIGWYLTRKAGLGTAEAVVREIIGSITLLSEHPGIGRSESAHGAGMRSFPAKQYRIYYRKSKGGILVLHIFHGARDQRKAWRNQ
jgi:toxin ParE1/3/4